MDQGQKKQRNDYIFLSSLLSCICTPSLSAAVNSIDWPLNRNLWALQSTWLCSLSLISSFYLHNWTPCSMMHREDLPPLSVSRCNRLSCCRFSRCQPNVPETVLYANKATVLDVIHYILSLVWHSCTDGDRTRTHTPLSRCERRRNRRTVAGRRKGGKWDEHEFCYH